MKEWKSGIYERPLGDDRLWVDGGGSAHVYCLRIGWREIYLTRGEIILTVIVGLFAGLIFGAGQAGFLKLPDRQPQLVEYGAPEPRLLGSTEATRPEAGNPDVHFVDTRGRAIRRPAAPAEGAAPASAQEPAAQPAPAPESGAAADPEPVA